MAQQKYTAGQILEAIKGTRGVRSAIAQKLGCHRHTVENYITRLPSVRQAIEDERESFMDLAEVKMMTKVADGSWPAVKFVLMTLGRNRGYVEQVQITGTGKAGAFLLGWAEDDSAEDQGHLDNQNGLPPASEAA